MKFAQALLATSLLVSGCSSMSNQELLQHLSPDQRADAIKTHSEMLRKSQREHTQRMVELEKSIQNLNHLEVDLVALIKKHNKDLEELKKTKVYIEEAKQTIKKQQEQLEESISNQMKLLGVDIG